MSLNIRIGQRLYVVPKYGIQASILGTVTGIERDERGEVLAIIIQPVFSTSVYLDMRDEGFSLVDAGMAARRSIPSC